MKRTAKRTSKSLKCLLAGQSEHVEAQTYGDASFGVLGMALQSLVVAYAFSLACSLRHHTSETHE
jgi:hypothetical protein